MNKQTRILVGSISVVGVLLFAIRLISIPDLFCDEVSYITQAYSLSYGKVLFKETTLMHMGAVLLAPFLWAYRHVAGSTDGIWLFSRLVFLALNLIIGILVYSVFRKQYSKGFVFGAMLSCVLYVASIPVLYYDSVGDFGLIVGTLLLYKVWQRKQLDVKSGALLIGSGLSFSVMAFAYPTMIALVVYFGGMLLTRLIFDGSWAKRRQMFLLYACGGLIALSVFMVYAQINIGISNCFNDIVTMAPSSMSTTIKWGNDSPPQFSAMRFMSFAKIIVACFAYLGIATLLGALFVIVLSLVFRRKTNWRFVLLAALLLAPFITPFLKEARLPGILAAYYSFWAIPLFFLTRNKCKSVYRILFFLIIPNLLAHIIYGMTATGPGRFIQGHYSGLLAFVLITPHFYMQDHESETRTTYKFAVFSTLVALSLSFSNFMRAPFSYTPFPELFAKGVVVKEGVLSGMIVEKTHVTYVKDVEVLAAHQALSIDIVFWGEYHKLGYLCQQQKPCIRNEWAPTGSCKKTGTRFLLTSIYFNNIQSYPDVTTSWNTTLEDFQKRQIVPDVLIVHPLEANAEDARLFISNYEKIMETKDCVVFHLKHEPL